MKELMLYQKKLWNRWLNEADLLTIERVLSVVHDIDLRQSIDNTDNFELNLYHSDNHDFPALEKEAFNQSKNGEFRKNAVRLMKEYDVIEHYEIKKNILKEDVIEVDLNEQYYKEFQRDIEKVYNKKKRSHTSKQNEDISLPSSGNKEERKIISRVTFNENTGQICINKRKHRKLRIDGRNYLVLRYLYKKTNKPISLNKLEEEALKGTHLSGSLHKFANRCGMKEALRMAFFPKITQAHITFRNKITQKEYRSEKLKLPRKYLIK